MSLSIYTFGLLLFICLMIAVAGLYSRRRSLYYGAAFAAIFVFIVWACLFAARPAWLRYATQHTVPTPTTSDLIWVTRSAGMETAELELKIENHPVDKMVLVRLEPRHYLFSVQWDSSATRTAEQWQQDLGASVVVSGSYFGSNFVPLTPIRHSGKSIGPTNYQSIHGAFVANNNHVDILDLKDSNVFDAINKYPDAMVSYPLLIDSNGINRAVESKTWLASRNFIVIDTEGRIIFGTTQTGFFTLRRLGDFLKTLPINIRIALNFDGGPLVSQVIHTETFTRNFHGTAEISNGSDVIRVYWHHYFGTNWPLPIVVVAIPVSQPLNRK